MPLYKVFDAAYPPGAAPAGCAGVLGYIGRTGKAAHVWTPQEWARFPKLTQFPCWVPDLSEHAGDEATAIVAALHAAGWEPRQSIGESYAVVIDYETAGVAEAEWHSHLGQQLGHQGFDAIAYGSLSTVTAIEAAHIWAGNWDGAATLEPGGQTIHAHQYTANVASGLGTYIDLSVADDWLMNLGLRR